MPENRTCLTPVSILVVSLVIAGLLLAACQSDQGQTESGATAEPSAADAKWEVAGHYTEACQCSVPCPCNFAQQPTHGNCDNTSVFQIDKGRYEDVSLDGLTVIVVGSSPEGERYIDTVGNLTFARYYIDERANQEQQQALEEIARVLHVSYQRLPVAKASADEEVKVVPIKASVGPNQAQAEIPGVLDFKTKALTGADGAERIEIVNGSIVIEWMPRVWSGQSETYKYTDAGHDWDYGGRSSYFATFHAHSNMPTLQAGGTGASHH